MSDWLQEIKPGPSFSAAMMRAILDGKKSQVRDELPRQPRVTHDSDGNDIVEIVEVTTARWGDFKGKVCVRLGGLNMYPAPYQPGELYYIREPVEEYCYDDDPISDTVYSSEMENEYTPYGAIRKVGSPNALAWDFKDDPIVWENEDGSKRKINKLPAHFMPRRCARRFALIEDVWAERVQDISEEDAIAEGIRKEKINTHCWYHTITGDHFRDFIDAWAAQWMFIHGEESWERNSWVFAHEFEVMDRDQASDYVEGMGNE